MNNLLQDIHDEFVEKHRQGLKLCDSCGEWYEPNSKTFDSKYGITVYKPDYIEGRAWKRTYFHLCEKCTRTCVPFNIGSLFDVGVEQGRGYNHEKTF